MTHQRDRTLATSGLARVEGEGAMHVRVRGSQVDEVRLDIYEPPRFFEAFLRGRSYTEPPDITARVCGICPVAYQTSACQAIEDACGARLDDRLVVIQHTSVRTSQFLEYGKPPPYAESTGSGTALLLRNGKAWTTHWSRPNANGGTTFTTASGQPMTFAQGQVWTVLAYR